MNLNELEGGFNYVQLTMVVVMLALVFTHPLNVMEAMSGGKPSDSTDDGLPNFLAPLNFFICVMERHLVPMYWNVAMN